MGASTRGTRRDRFYLNMGIRAMFDMLVTQARESGVAQPQIAKLAKKLIKVVSRIEIEKVKKARQGPEEDDV